MKPSGPEREVLLRAAVSAPSMHNTQPWRFRFAPDAIGVYRDRSRELAAEDADGRMLHLSLGAACLNLRVAAAKLGHGAATRYLIDPAQPDLVAEVELWRDLPPDHELKALYDAIPVRRTNRQPYTGERIPDDVRARLSTAAGHEKTMLEWIQDPARLHWLRMTIADADLEDGWDPARTSERRHWVGGLRGSGDGIPVSALGPRPYSPTAPVRDLAVDASDMRRRHAYFEREPQLAVLSTRFDGPDEWLRAGQALERVLLEATKAGVATSLLNQAIEHHQLRWLVRDPLGATARPQAVIRLGYGPDVPATPRRPLHDVVLPDE